MQMVDLTLFQYESLPIKCQSRTYIINTVPSNIELDLLHIQGNAHSLATNGFQGLDEVTLSAWKKLVKDLIILNKLEVIESDIDDLSPLQVICVITALNQIVDKRAQTMSEILKNSKKK